jgi:hypothetical protein
MIEKMDKSLEEKLWEDEYAPATKHGARAKILGMALYGDTNSPY